jgi:ribosomal protein S18 acetylase RimI-like enzyme
MESGMNIYKAVAPFAFQTFSCYLYESVLVERDEADYFPRIGNLTFVLVKSKPQLDGLAAFGFNLSTLNVETRAMLEQGALVGLLFVGQELASLEWAAASQRANRAINIYPLKIDFSRQEAYASGVWTSPRFRRNGLHTYVYYKLYESLRKCGVTKVKSIVATDNIAAQKAHQRFAPQERIYARARYLKILGMQFWSEEPLDRRSEIGRWERLPSFQDR